MLLHFPHRCALDDCRKRHPIWDEATKQWLCQSHIEALARAKADHPSAPSLETLTKLEPLTIKGYNDDVPEEAKATTPVIDPCKNCGEPLTKCIAREDYPAANRSKHCCIECEH